MYDSAFLNWVRRATLTVLLGGLACIAPFSARAANSVTLAWDKSTNATVTGYNLYYGTTSRTYNQTLVVGNSTNSTVSGLLAGTTYFFAATAYDATGAESDFSNEATYSVPATTNSPPTLDPIASVTINEDSGSQSVSLTGITSGAPGESQTLSVSATSSNPGLTS